MSSPDTRASKLLRLGAHGRALPPVEATRLTSEPALFLIITDSPPRPGEAKGEMQFLGIPLSGSRLHEHNQTLRELLPHIPPSALFETAFGELSRWQRLADEALPGSADLGSELLAHEFQLWAPPPWSELPLSLVACLYCSGFDLNDANDDCRDAFARFAQRCQQELGAQFGARYAGPVMELIAPCPNLASLQGGLPPALIAWAQRASFEASLPSASPTTKPRL